MLREQIDDLVKTIKRTERERGLLAFSPLIFAYFISWFDGGVFLQRPNLSFFEAGLMFASSVIIIGIWTIILNHLRAELRSLLRIFYPEDLPCDSEK